MISTIGILLLVVGEATASRIALRDVPLGECHGCEVTCFEDCTLKYEREILADDFFIQVPSSTGNTSSKNITIRTNVGREYVECLREDNCPCPKDQAKAAKAARNGSALLQTFTPNATCALVQNTAENKTAASCAMDCSHKVTQNAYAKLEKKKNTKSVKKQTFLDKEKHYPIHSVQVGIFSRGAMNMDQCIKFCLAATCGCDKAPGLDTIDKLMKAIKQNDAANPGEKDFSHKDAGFSDADNRDSHHGADDDMGGAVVDTAGSYKFRPAKVEECAKGMIGKKVSKGLYIDMGGGVGGELEICSTELMERIFGPGDHKDKLKLCKSTKSDDATWGCIWNEKKGYCGVGFSPNLHCQKRYIQDPTRLL
jgi:hypothetical protein